jgi:hypothetical protein
VSNKNKKIINNNLWRLWCKSLGEKASPCDKESDKIAIIRTFIFLTYLITNVAIISNAIRHWNNSENNKSTIIILVGDHKSR